jgi:hypothetical protein
LSVLDPLYRLERKYWKECALLGIRHGTDGKFEEASNMFKQSISFNIALCNMF